MRAVGGNCSLTGELPDGRKVNVRDHSSDGRPTLEVQEGKNRIKVRYGKEIRSYDKNNSSREV